MFVYTFLICLLLLYCYINELMGNCLLEAELKWGEMSVGLTNRLVQLAGISYKWATA